MNDLGRKRRHELDSIDPSIILGTAIEDMNESAWKKFIIGLKQYKKKEVNYAKKTKRIK
jgi:hypothetical protein